MHCLISANSFKQLSGQKISCLTIIDGNSAALTYSSICCHSNGSYQHVATFRVLLQISIYRIKVGPEIKMVSYDRQQYISN